MLSLKKIKQRKSQQGTLVFNEQSEMPEQATADPAAAVEQHICFSDTDCLVIPDTVNVIFETVLTHHFDRLVIVCMRGKDAAYDILFNQNGEPVFFEHPHPEKVNLLAAFFDKTFVKAKLRGVDCLANLISL